MCEVCEKNGRDFNLLKPFLKVGVEIEFINGDDGDYQAVHLKYGEEKLEICATGDEGGYFHFDDSGDE